MQTRVRQKTLRVKRFGPAFQLSKPIGKKPRGGTKEAGAKRNPISIFTFASRRRLRLHLEMYGESYTHEITLTYPGEWVTTDVRIEQKHMAAFLRKLLAHGVEFYLWRKEYQERGAIHWHVLVDRFINKDWIRDSWAGILGAPARTRIDKIRDKDRMRRYLSCYFGKLEQSTVPVGVVGHGRWWGSNRPIKPTDEFTLHFDDPKEAATILRNMDRWYGVQLKGWGTVSGKVYKRPARRAGFTIFGVGDRAEYVFTRLVTGYGNPEILL